MYCLFAASCHSPAQSCTVLHQQTSHSWNASSVRCIVLDVVGAAEMSQQAPPPASAYIPNATAAVSSLNAQLSKPECCSFRVQLQQAVLPGVFPVFCRGTSESPPLSSFCTTRLVLTRRSCPTPSWLTSQHHQHLSPPRLWSPLMQRYSLLLLSDAVWHLSRYPKNVQNGWEIILVFWELAILYWLWSQVQLFQQKYQSLLEGDPTSPDHPLLLHQHRCSVSASLVLHRAWNMAVCLFTSIGIIEVNTGNTCWESTTCQTLSR